MSKLKKIDREKLIQSGILMNSCAVCGIGPSWHGQELILVLDFINGVQTDIKLSNLRLLCPNCNSQQYNLLSKGLNKTNFKIPCNRCGMPRSHNAKSGLCRQCSGLSRRHQEWATLEELQKLITENISWKEIGRRYKVSDNTAKRWARIYGLIP